MSERVVVVFSGGGTGGHLYPALALADALRARRPDVDAVFVGAARGIEARVLPERGERVYLLPVEGIPRGGGWKARLRAGWALVRSLVVTVGHFRTLRPALVVVTGGYAGGPAGLAAAALGVPLVLQEQNARAGVTTRILARWAREVHVAFPEAEAGLRLRKTGAVFRSGNPVRVPDLNERKKGSGDPRPLRVLVVGGSQGAKALNEAVLAWLGAHAAPTLNPVPPRTVLWAAGPAHVDAIRVQAEALFGGTLPPWLELTGYIEDMPKALAQSDLAVSRAGATGTAEFLAWGIPSVLVPLPTAADDHQTVNAQALASAGACIWFAQDGLSRGRFTEAVEGLLADPVRRTQMAEAARAAGRPHAAEMIATHLERCLPQGPRLDRAHL